MGFCVVKLLFGFFCECSGFYHRNEPGLLLFLFRQTFGIPMGTNYPPLLADIFLYWHEAECIHSLLSTVKKQNFTNSVQSHRYIDDVLSINNPEFENYLGQMYPVDQGHHREHHFCFLPRFTTVDWEGWSTSHIHLQQTKWFPHHKLSVTELLYSIFAGLWRFYLSAYTIRPGLILVWMFYSEGQATFQ